MCGSDPFCTQLVEWMGDRGARNFVLTSRSGVTTATQGAWLRRWQTKGYSVRVSTHNVVDGAQCRQLLDSIQVLGGIFHLTLVLADAFFPSLTESTWAAAVTCKSVAAQNLHDILLATRRSVDHFVLFSSVTSGFGNAGQSNYGYGNSAMERLVEDRRALGLPAVAIQWGGIGDVGFVAKNHASKSKRKIQTGTMQLQSIRSCLTTLEQLLPSPHAVVTSWVVSSPEWKGKAPVAATASGAASAATANTTGSAAASASHDNDSGTGTGPHGMVSSAAAGEVVAKIATVMGIDDVSTIDESRTLGENGLDSLMSIEIRQLLKEAGHVITVAKLSVMTFAHIRALFASGGAVASAAPAPASATSASSATAVTAVAVAAVPAAVPVAMGEVVRRWTSSNDSAKPHTHRAVYVICGMFVDPTKQLAHMNWDVDAVFVVHWQCASDFVALCRTLADHVHAQRALTPTVTMVGHSYGSLILNRFLSVTPSVAGAVKSLMLSPPQFRLFEHMYVPSSFFLVDCAVFQ
jgi:fatty acid synthase